jgi:Flp pilus assembly protein TadD
LERSIREFRTALELKPRDPEIRYNFALALLRQGNSREAILQLRFVTKQTPDNGEALCLLARLLIKTGQTVEGRDVLERARKLNSCSIPEYDPTTAN